MKFQFLDKFKEYGPVFIRIAIGGHLIYGVQDNIFSWERMVEFSKFLETNNFPFPIYSAMLSAYAQLFCGGFFVLGLFTRPAALVMIINFIIALIMVHWGLPYVQNASALQMLAASLFLFIHGPGKLSLDENLQEEKRQEN